jgi:hypothetical protein
LGPITKSGLSTILDDPALPTPVLVFGLQRFSLLRFPRRIAFIESAGGPKSEPISIVKPEPTVAADRRPSLLFRDGKVEISSEIAGIPARHGSSVETWHAQLENLVDSRLPTALVLSRIVVALKDSPGAGFSVSKGD